jgi:hypothetical protein
VQKLSKGTKICPYLSFWGEECHQLKKNLSAAGSELLLPPGLGGYLVWPVRTWVVLELPRTEPKSGLIFGAEMRTRFQSGFGSGIRTGTQTPL